MTDTFFQELKEVVFEEYEKAVDWAIAQHKIHKDDDRLDGLIAKMDKILLDTLKSMEAVNASYGPG